MVLYSQRISLKLHARDDVRTAHGRGSQIALTWPRLAIRQTSSGESGAPGQIWQTLSAESVPALPTGGEVLAWQDDAWMLRLRRELSFSHLLELSRASERLSSELIRSILGPPGPVVSS